MADAILWRMRAIAVTPGRVETAAVVELPEPPVTEGSVLARTLLVGICGTDAEIAYDGYGTPPAGSERLVLGHESLAEVIEAPSGTGLLPGDLIAGVVRRPDPVPCEACKRDEWDMCRNGRFVELGIRGEQGYGRERFRLDPRFAVRLEPELGELGVLLEPTSVVAKAWEHAEHIFTRARFEPRVALVIGAGPIGLLAALIARQRGLETHVVDLVTDGPKPALVADLGAAYHAGAVADVPATPDVVIECTGIGELVLAAIGRMKPGGVMALAGLSQSRRPTETHLDLLNADIVLGNKAVFGTVNAARRHYDQAAIVLARAEKQWLARLITRRVAPEQWPEALEKRPEDIKVVVEMTRAA